MDPIKDTFKKTLSDLEAEQKDQEFDFFRQEQLDLEEKDQNINYQPNIGQVEPAEQLDPLNNPVAEAPAEKTPEKWINQSYDGKLAVDVYQTSHDIIIKSTIAGCSSEDIDISINNQMVTIKGARTPDEDVSEEDYFFRECYWGGFSRSIILPIEVDPTGCEASIQNGILTIRLPKAENQGTRIAVKSFNEEIEIEENTPKKNRGSEGFVDDEDI